MKRILVIVFLTMFFTNIYAEQNLVDKTTVGYGSTYQKALSAALFEAVKQVNGAKVGSNVQLHEDFKRIVKLNENSTYIETNSHKGMVENIFSEANGLIKSYTIRKVQKPVNKDDHWEVTVEAKIPLHTSYIADRGRQSIAVMPFRFIHSTYALDDMGQSSNGYQLSSRIRDKILSSLSQTQQFVVLNRSIENEFNSEKALLSSNNVSASEASRLGNVIGADFMITGRINDLTSKVKTKNIYGMKNNKVKDEIDLSYQIIEVNTQKILFADTITTSLERNKDEGVTVTLDHVANLIISSTLDNLYPIKVLDVTNVDEIYLNQGKARIKEGDVFALFSQGRIIKDVDTGVEIRTDGRKVAELTVTSVLTKYSLAKTTYGSVSMVKPGDIVRLLVVDKEELNKDETMPETPGSSDAPIKW